MESDSRKIETKSKSTIILPERKKANEASKKEGKKVHEASKKRKREVKSEPSDDEDEVYEASNVYLFEGRDANENSGMVIEEIMDEEDVDS